VRALRPGAVAMVAVVAIAVLTVAARADARAAASGLAVPREKQIAMELVSSAENSTLDWGREYGYIEDIGDGNGYTAGLIGFCSGTGDMLEIVEQ
jgi:chitosanase